MMEKRNVVNEDQTPDHELKRTDEDWDKKAAEDFDTKEVSKDGERK